jgi:hypothetical protein
MEALRPLAVDGPPFLVLGYEPPLLEQLNPFIMLPLELLVPPEPFELLH